MLIAMVAAMDWVHAGVVHSHRPSLHDAPVSP